VNTESQDGVPLLALSEVIGRSGELDGKRLRVQGRLSLDFEDMTLRPPDLPKRSRDTSRKLWVRLPTAKKGDLEQLRERYSNAVVEVLGTLDANDHGHLDMLPATIAVIDIRGV